jgi:hypothetical protein
MRRRTVLPVLLSLAALPALAQDRPQLVPTRDVAVTYRFVGAGMPADAPQTMQVAWLAAQGLMRSEVPGMGWMVVDRRGGRAFMVMEQMRMVMDVPNGAPGQASAELPASASFRREGTATVASHRCTIWSYQDGGNQGRACVTDEGVMLRAEGTSQGRSGGMEATQVTFAAQDPRRFQRPAGYQTMQMPQGMPPGMMRPPGR